MKQENKKKNTKLTALRKKLHNNPMFNSTEVIILMIVGILLGSAITMILYGNRINLSSNYVKVDDNIQTMIDTYNNIIDNYYEDVDKEIIVDGAIEGMLASIEDPYTTYMDSAAYDNFNINLVGSYTGLGLEISVIDDKLTIVGIFNDSPASEVGLKLGDVIKSIDGQTSEEMSSSDFSNYVRNGDKTQFELVIERDGKEITYNIERKNVVLKSVASKVFNEGDKKIGYIYMSIFASNTYSQFKQELEDLQSQNIDSLIIDLRSNTGGELVGASNIISLFLNNDKIMYQTQTKEETKEYRSTGTKDFELPLVVLVDGNSASASEVLTAALKENLNATVIGKTTYGKGTVQELLTLSNGDQYKMTTRKWLTPNGNWINETGITPDIEVELSSAYQNDPTDENDNQLQTALKYLKEQ